MAFPIRSPLRGDWPQIPPSWLAYVEAEDRAYCRMNQIEFRKRVAPEYRAGAHPRSAYAALSMTRSRTMWLAGQQEAFSR